MTILLKTMLTLLLDQTEHSMTVRYVFLSRICSRLIGCSIDWSDHESEYQLLKKEPIWTFGELTAEDLESCNEIHL